MVLVTGGAQGLGSSIVRIFSSYGYDVIIGYLTNYNLAKKLSCEVNEKYNVNSVVKKIDITNQEDVKSMFSGVGSFAYQVGAKASRIYSMVEDKVSGAGTYTSKNETSSSTSKDTANIIAKIKCTRAPAMATLRTKVDTQSDIIVGFGMGVRHNFEEAQKFADLLGAETAASRAMVDSGNAPYEKQVGVTGKMASPQIYIAVGISGAVHHISGIRSAGKIIAINPDKNAPIFNFADYGIVASLEEVWSEMNKNA
jgi:electron transfer flavoprotein alpha subunit